MGEWIQTAYGLVTLITAVIGLIGTGIGVYFSIRNWIKAFKEKDGKQKWELLMKILDAAMQQAEKSGKSGADKKEMVIDIAKESCKAAGINIDDFIDQVAAYIDETIAFVNGMVKKGKK